MSYQALYRVWRPQSFNELVGQEMIAQTLKNAVAHRQLSHAYLFAGPRGTGKTSVAKILAKAVNCPHQVDGNPCNECEFCQGITAGRMSDVIEIDAASNNGVDEIRDLRDKVRYAPTQLEYKVYIIDEVHMLTTGAFNALLKTLEEPPDKVLFILATTEPHKIPATILSRTQRFDFQRIQEFDLIGRMAYILDQEHTDYDEDALKVIARAANGGMRDALSLLDQALSFQRDRLSKDTALAVTGSFAQPIYVNYLLALVNQDTGPALELLSEQFQAGKQASRFIEELILFIRDVLLSLYSSKNYTLLEDQEIQPLKDQIEVSFYYSLIERLNQVQHQMRFSSQPELYLEVLTVQVSQTPLAEMTETNKNDHHSASHSAPLEAQLAQVKLELEAQKQALDHLMARVQEGGQAIQAPNSASSSADLVPRDRPHFVRQDYCLDLHDVYGVLNQATKKDLNQLQNHWPEVLAVLPPQLRSRFYQTQALAAGPEAGLISFEDQRLCGLVQAETRLKEQVNHLISEKLGTTIQLAYIWQGDWQKVRKDYKILFDKNGRQPIPLPEKKPPQESEESSPLPVQDRETNAPASDKSADRTSTVENREAPKEASNSVASGGVAALFKRSQENLQTESSPEEEESILEAEGQTDMFALEENEEIDDPVVTKAVELFGKENLTIYSDR